MSASRSIARPAARGLAARCKCPTTTPRNISASTISQARSSFSSRTPQALSSRRTTPFSQQTSDSRRRRQYHSYDHPPPPGVFSAAEQTILSAAYRHIPEHGFSQHALALGAQDAGYLDISTNLLPDGVFSLIRYHLVTQREGLAGRARELFGGSRAGRENLSIAEKVESLAWERLLGNAAIIERWQEALAIMAQPSYVPASLKELSLLADEILFVAGDVSVDPSWYTKRASLSTVYAATELFMTNDRSEGFADTKKFLQRRLGEAHEVSGFASSVGQWLSFTASAGVNVLRSKGMRI